MTSKNSKKFLSAIENNEFQKIQQLIDLDVELVECRTINKIDFISNTDLESPYLVTDENGDLISAYVYGGATPLMRLVILFTI